MIPKNKSIKPSNIKSPMIQKQEQSFEKNPGLSQLPENNNFFLQNTLRYSYLTKTGSDQTIASGGSGATITFASNSTNDKRTTATANTITIKKTGEYIVYWFINIDASSTGEVTLELEKNWWTTLDTINTTAKQVKEINPAGEYTLAGSIPISLSDGDALTLNITHNTGAGFVVKAGGDSTFRAYAIA